MIIKITEQRIVLYKTSKQIIESCSDIVLFYYSHYLVVLR